MPVRSDILSAVKDALSYVPGLVAVTKNRATPHGTLPLVNITAAQDVRGEPPHRFATYRQPMDPRSLAVILELVVAGQDEAAAVDQVDALMLEIERHTIGDGAGAANLRALVTAGTVLDYTWTGVEYSVDGETDRVLMLAEIGLTFEYLPPPFSSGGQHPPDEWPEDGTP